MKAYAPNLSDPRVLKRIKAAYGYVLNVFDEEEPTSKAISSLVQSSGKNPKTRFGQQQTDMFKWLKQHLLICVDTHYSHAAGKSMKYVINKDGAAKIKQMLLDGKAIAFSNDELPTVTEATVNDVVALSSVEVEHKDELVSLDFQYSDKSNRLFNPIQNLKKCIKKPLLAKHGLKYHYDIQCCAPTLLYQHAQQQLVPLKKELTALQSYLDDRKSFRAMLTEQAEIGEQHGFKADTAKRVVNALFCGAKLGNNPQWQLSEVLQYKQDRIDFLKQHDGLKDLRKDIKTMWDAIKPSMHVSGALTPKQKWDCYFALERKVLDAAREFLTKSGNKCFLEHDGWSTAMMIDVVALKRHVFKRTGFVIEVECEYVEEESDIVCDPAHHNISALSPFIPHVYMISDIAVSSPCAKLEVDNEIETVYSSTWLDDYLQRNKRKWK